MRLFSFELKKIIFSKKFLYTMLFIVAGVSLLFLRNTIFYSYVEKEESEHVNTLVQASQSNFRMHQQVIRNDPENEEANKLQKINDPMLEKLYELRTLTSSKDWQHKLSLKNDILLSIMEYKEAGGDFPLTNKEINHMLALNEKLLMENIPPEHDTYSQAFPNFMKMVVNLFINFGAIILLLLLVGETMSSEFENRSINLLLTQPLKRTHIFTSKFWSAIIAYLITIGVFLVAVIIIGVIFGKDGTFDYPIVMERDNGIEFVKVSEYMVQGLVIASVTIFMLISLVLFYSLIFKHTLSTLFVLLVTILVGYALTTFVTWAPFAWINPFQYFLPGEMILNQNDRVWYQGIPVILLVTVIFYVVARQKVKSSRVD